MSRSSDYQMCNEAIMLLREAELSIRFRDYRGARTLLAQAGGLFPKCHPKKKYVLKALAAMNQRLAVRG